ncbi:MAG TPA: hypothetical protein VKA03_05910 [Methylovirgula sp.]|nr:hypothetical protein [Methylovirgula sp.]
MPVQPLKFAPHALAAAILAVLSLYAVDARAEPGPFTSLAGYWRGDGTISMKDGSRERLRCRATYAVSQTGDSLNQTLLCASDSYKFDVNSSVTEEDGAISGSWTETTRNASGSVSGQVNGSVIEVAVTGAGFTAGISIVTHSRTQSVSIKPQGGTDVVGVTVTLHRER